MLMIRTDMPSQNLTSVIRIQTMLRFKNMEFTTIFIKYMCIFKRGVLGLVLFNDKYLELDGKSLAKKFGVKYVETSPGKQGVETFFFSFPETKCLS